MRKNPDYNQRFKLSLGFLKDQTQKVIASNRLKHRKQKSKVEIPTKVLKKINDKTTLQFRKRLK